MKKIVIAGRNDSGKSTVLGELYKGLINNNFQPLVVGSGSQDEKPYLQKGVKQEYLTIAIPEAGRDLIMDLDKTIKSAVNILKETNNLLNYAQKALEELNKIRSVLDKSQIDQQDLPLKAVLPDVALIEAVGINDGYKSADSRNASDILISVVPANIKSEIIMDEDNVLLDQADIIVITKADQAPKNETMVTQKLLQKIYPDKPIINVVATEGIHMARLLEEIIRQINLHNQMADQNN